VMLPPGRLRLAMRPSMTGSPPVTNTISTVVMCIRPRAQDQASALLRLLSRIILRVDVAEAPRAGGVDLHDGVFVKEEIVRHAGSKREEAARGQRLSLALIGSLSHSQTDRPRDHRVDFRLRMRVR